MNTRKPIERPPFDVEAELEKLRTDDNFIKFLGRGTTSEVEIRRRLNREIAQCLSLYNKNYMSLVLQHQSVVEFHWNAVFWSGYSHLIRFEKGGVENFVYYARKAGWSVTLEKTEGQPRKDCYDVIIER